ncbi:MAG: glycosyltransferase [Caulobacteraceae bacterium]|nr:glycosyltransferase [Caulobacteraceae bacterium]
MSQSLYSDSAVAPEATDALLEAAERRRVAPRKQPWLFPAVFGAWALAVAYFGPRLLSLVSLADSGWGFASIAFFAVFAQIAWLYGFYNIAVVVFALIDRSIRREPVPVVTAKPAVAILYTTCDDFVERSAESCVEQDYPNFHVYLLDDSSTLAARARVDDFAIRHPDRVTVVRRQNRQGFKAGNLNHALEKVAHEPLFAVVDADEVLPTKFLADMTPWLLSNDACGFVQANHRSRPDDESPFARDLGVGIDIHWKWYQPLRNRYGFVMFLGHGALLRRSCWQEVGGFPEIVSEDLGYAIALRERGYYGRFVEDVVCQEEFPATVRAFRIRHVKWTRGTCEFLHQWMARLVRAKNITTTEKLDILFPTLNLLLTFFFFLFMINAALILPMALGVVRDLTIVIFGQEFVVPTMALRTGAERMAGLDFFAITMMTIVAPVLCFILSLASQPLKLVRFLAYSTAIYAALSPLSFIAVVGYALSRRAQFLVTGANASAERRGQRGGVWEFLCRTHPDSTVVQAIEFGAGAGFLAAALMTFQVGFAGVAIGFMLLPLMHEGGWRRGAARVWVWAPFTLIATGVAMGSAGVMGLQPVLFGFGFHF